MNKQRGQIQIIVIIGIVLSIIGVYFWSSIFGGKDGQVGNEKVVANPNDTVPPQRTNLLPSGVLSLNTTKTTLSLTTDEPAYCRYSTEAGKAYANMSKGFNPNKAKTSHSIDVAGLQNSKAYKYYARCQDLAGNRNTDDALIEFSVGVASAPASGGPAFSPVLPSEAPPARSNLLPSGTLSSGTTKTNISLITNEPAYCRYSIQPEISYAKMSKGFSPDTAKLQHTATVSGLSENKLYEYYVRCRDLKGNENNDDAVIKFGVGGASSPLTPSGADVTPPNRFGASPNKDLSAGTRQTTISLQTDETAICRYNTTAGLSYDAMGATFSKTNSTSHSTEIYGLNEGASYKYYVRCADQKGNKNTNDFIISFKVETAKDETPPVVSNPSHTGNLLPYGTNSAVISVSTGEPATCRYSAAGGVSYSSMSYSFSHYDQTKKFHVKTVTGLKNGTSYDYYVRCRDLAGNANTGDVLISFSVDRSGLPQ